MDLRMYFDKSLTVERILQGKMVANEGDLYIGAYIHRIGVAGSGFDNIQIFNNALTIDEITILALANKDVITD